MRPPSFPAVASGDDRVPVASMIAIMQPTYLPWAGYFNLISRVDRFIFLNNVQLDKPSWQVRNRILLNGDIHMITVPTLGPREQRIDQTLLSGDAWRRKHVTLLKHAYAKHAHGPEVIDLVSGVILDESIKALEQLNIRLIRALCERMGLACNFTLASDVETEGGRAFRLLELCRHFGVSEYLSPAGSKEYIDEDKAFVGSGVNVEYQSFTPAKYAQRGAAEFVGSLSIVDVAANLGFRQTLEYVRGSASTSAR